MPQPFADELHDRSAGSAHPTGRLFGISRDQMWMLLVAAAIAGGIWVRTLSPGSLLPAAVNPFAWRSQPTVNLYFVDGAFLFPVSHRLPSDEHLPRTVLDALLAGPRRSARLKSAIPPDVAIRSFAVIEGTARIDLSRRLGQGGGEQMALAAITETMTRVPGIRSVAVSVQGIPLAASASRTPQLYFPSADGLVAVPSKATGARAALDAYLSGPPAPEMTGVPSDVRVLAYDYDAADRVLSIGFSYTPAVRALALEKPERTRMLLLGLIASLTEFPEVRAVRLDFGGQSRLGLGECSDLLRSPQPRPALLNDERLLD
jgi:spore germination protein GerM